MPVQKEFFRHGTSLGVFRGSVVKRFDDTNVYRVVYTDGDREDYTIDELLPLLIVGDDVQNKIKTAHNDLIAVLAEAKKTDRNEYLYRSSLLRKAQTDKTWFGLTLTDRRKLSCSLMNFCVFRHPVGGCTCDNGVSPWLKATPAKPCIFRHDPAVCKCNQIAIKLSQDECSYAAYLLQKREWRVQGKHSLRKKSPGPPLMVSEYASFEFGLGFFVNADSLTEINRVRAAAGSQYYSEPASDHRLVKKKPLAYYEHSDSITVHCMMPGEDKDGWWSLDKILRQAEDVEDVLRVLAPPRLYQYIPFYDNSATHNKRETLTLSTSNLLAKWGGKKPGLRDSTLVDGCVGPNAATLWCIPGKGSGEWRDGPKWLQEEVPGAVLKTFTLAVGDVDYGRFCADDPPPFYDLKAQRYDRPMTATEKNAERSR